MLDDRHYLICLVIVIALCPAVWAQSHQPYAGQETRAIKALSAAKIEDYQSGSGMGFAKAAELNHYPGPKHVMELADELRLTADQRVKTQAIYDTMHQEAVQLGQRIVDTERQLDHLFASKTITDATLQDQIRDIAATQGRLRVVHLKAHLAQHAILTSEQIQRYDTLRGYRRHGQQGPQHRHRH
ncbi:MAG: Spy/CpxP family protein refolding chaperone [Candidatus Tectomicrobia bacterium]|nr:Spy/CpxP family protein refolding chaperone [Candidatus Tectomicrobia bacterium]